MDVSRRTVQRYLDHHLDGVLQHRQEDETALEQVEGLSEEFAPTLPAFTERLDGRLDEEARSLAGMER